MFDMDRYYTPVDLAGEFIADNTTEVPQSCVDSTCGTGNLLRAASDCFEGIQCFGLDRDRKVINALRRKEPDWTLSVGDVLRPESYTRTDVLSSDYRCDLLLLNPPFSHNGRKYFPTTVDGQEIKASTAMIHILRALELFEPRLGGIVVVPESLTHSETDECARAILSAKYEWRSIYELPQKTFYGTRARAEVLQLIPITEPPEPDSETQAPSQNLNVELIRGSLPVHAVKESRHGIPFVHSTDIASIQSCPSGNGLLRTSSDLKGRVSGWLILLPRVGVPKSESTAVVCVRKPVHLSDCVIAVKAPSRQNARHIKKLLDDSWADFIRLYRGTGARYTTIKKLSAWLAERGVAVTVK